MLVHVRASEVGGATTAKISTEMEINGTVQRKVKYNVEMRKDWREAPNEGLPLAVFSGQTKAESWSQQGARVSDVMRRVITGEWKGHFNRVLPGTCRIWAQWRESDSNLSLIFAFSVNVLTNTPVFGLEQGGIHGVWNQNKCFKSSRANLYLWNMLTASLA